MRGVLSVLVFWVVGCSSEANRVDQGVLKTFESDTRYERNLDFPGMCKDGVKVDPEQLENCIQVLEFKADGIAHIMLTDIYNLGTYSKSDHKIFATFNSIDAPPSIEFDILDNGKKLMEIHSHREWLLVDE